MTASSPLRALALGLLLGLLLPSLRAQDETPDEAYAFAAGLHDRGLHERAEKSFADFIARHPKDRRLAAARFYRGQSLVALGRDEEALPLFGAYVASGEKPLRRQALLRAGELLQRAGKGADALRALDALLQEGAGDEEEAAWYFVGEAARQAGDGERADRAHAKVVASWPAGRYAPWSRLALAYRALEADRGEDALELFRAAAKEDSLRLEAEAMAAESLLVLGRFDEAEAAYGALAKAATDRFAAQVSLGRARAAFGRGDLGRAMKAFRAHAAAHPDDPRAPRALIRAAAKLHEDGKGKEGLALLKLVKGATGQDAADLAYWSGRILDAGGDTEAALTELAAAASRSPRRKFAYADALARAGRFEEAQRTLAELTGETKDAALLDEARFARAFALNRLERHEEAIAVLRPLLRDGIEDGFARDVLFALGENAFALERRREAEAWFDRLIARGPGAWHAESLYKKGWCAYGEDRARDAAKAFGALVAADPRGPFAAEASYLIGKCHEKLGENAEGGSGLPTRRGGGGGRRLRSARASRRRGGGAPRGTVRRGRDALRRARPREARTGPRRGGLGRSRRVPLRGRAPRGGARGLGPAPEAGARSPARARSAHRPGLVAPRSVGAARPRRPPSRPPARRPIPAVAAERSTSRDSRSTRRVGAPRPPCRCVCWRRARSIPDAARRSCCGASRSRRPVTTPARADPSSARRPTPRFPGGTRPSTSSVPARSRGRRGRSGRGLHRAREGLRREPARAGRGLPSRRVGLRPRGLGRRPRALRARRGPRRRRRPRRRARLQARLVPGEARAAARRASPSRPSPRTRRARSRRVRLPRRGRGGARGRLRGGGGRLRGDGREAPAPRERRRRARAAGALSRRRRSPGEDVVALAPVVLARARTRRAPRGHRVGAGDAPRPRSPRARPRGLPQGGGPRARPLAARAQFRIGECFRAAGDRERAIDEMLKVAILYAHAEWVAKATATAADLLEEGGEKEKAAKLRADLLREHPDSPEAKRLRAKGVNRG
ncbi:MAG: tetratricopeptide repeat protein [Planctomycetota bacterium]